MFTPTDEKADDASCVSKLSEIFRKSIIGSLALIIAIMAILLGFAYNEDKSVEFRSYDIEESFASYWNESCASDVAQGQSIGSREKNNKIWFDYEKVEPNGRTLRSTNVTDPKITSKPIRRGDRLVEIPRSFQIWELDAIRSELVQSERLLTARHKLTDNPLAGGAFLAAYLAFDQKLMLSVRNDSKDGDVDDSDGHLTKKDRVFTSYFRSLPSWEELQTYHPILAKRSDLISALRHHSLNFAEILMHKEMVDSEYDALSSVSPEVFGKKISIEEYQIARIYVMSRSFNPGAKACSSEIKNILSESVLQRIESDLGVDFIQKPLFGDGCHAMVPILDMLNSHPQPNVVYKYSMELKSFVISAKKDISSQWELINSYGKYSDAHLYAKFGFINGDGSGYTQASIALFHRPLGSSLGQEFTLIPNSVLNGNDTLSFMERIPDIQKEELKRYLQFDDGYNDCIQKHLHPSEFKLKKLKWMHLANIANNPKSWIVTLKPRMEHSRPKKSSDLLISESPPKVDPRKLRMDINHLMYTCRLLSLTVDDYNGNAAQILEDNLDNNTFVAVKGNDALEYRSIMFLARLAGTALMQYLPITPEIEYENVHKMNKQELYNTPEWVAAQLRLGEMQSLQALSGVARSYANGLLSKRGITPIGIPFKMRERSCPKEYTNILDYETM